MIDGIIIKGVGGLYAVSTPEGLYACTARGVFRNRSVTPIPGDRVRIDSTDAFNTAERTGFLREILPRDNELPRPRIANVNQAIVVMAAARPAFDPVLLDRYLAVIAHAGIPAVICINKYDICDKEVFDETFPRIYTEAGYAVICTSAVTGEGVETLRGLMADMLSAFSGPSGAGKSSLINVLMPGLTRETGTLSEKIDRGRHTTRHTEILSVQPSGFCADTPGFTSLDMSGIPAKRYASLFREFAPFLGQCRFSDCRHLAEIGCAVKEQVGRAIHPSRYESYARMVTGWEGAY
jgi:ribosome biogenesis GTPase